MKITINEALANYLEDLSLNGFYRSINANIDYYSSGTPEFKDDATMDAYINAIKSLITEEDAA